MKRKREEEDREDLKPGFEWVLKFREGKKEAQVQVCQQFLSAKESKELFDQLKAILDDGESFGQDVVRVFGKEHKAPRLTCSFADKPRTYVYSGMRQTAKPWPEFLAKLRDRLQPLSDTELNYVLVNAYPTGDHRIGYHSDNEKDMMRKESTIVSLTVGRGPKAERDFCIKRHSNKAVTKVKLKNGSVLLMEKQTQALTAHSLPKRKIEGGEAALRFNLTWRSLVEEGE